MAHRIDLDTAGTVLSVGLLPYSDNSGYQLRITIRCEPDDAEKSDKIEIDGVGDNQVTIAVMDWMTVRDTIDRLVGFTSELVERT